MFDLIFLQIDVFDNDQKNFDCTIQEAIQIFVFTFVYRHNTRKDLLYNRNKFSLENKMIKTVVKVSLLSKDSVEFVWIIVSN